ncbi:MAG: DEAD/DEAH box helicase family protein [Leptospiraceae bacterium]|nr:DEAD/DEAH box helicase family protein [Leptospiraceae bacterium]
MSFYDTPIINSPYGYPARHWELDDAGQPTDRLIESRRLAAYVTPVPRPRRQGRGAQQALPLASKTDGVSSDEQEYDPIPIINQIRNHVDEWRKLPNPADWGVTPETRRLLQHWRSYEFQSYRPFFCQVEAVETIIWLWEVAPRSSKKGRVFWEHIQGANEQANPALLRLALKLATGAGKTTVMAMLIAWQTLNAVRRKNSQRFTRGFLIVVPGITIRDRLRVLQPSDPENYYEHRELVPPEMIQDIHRAKIVITNYHAFRQRETLEISKVGRSLLQGDGPALNTIESEGEMLRRALPELMGLKNILVLNDEAHHCYRERPDVNEVNELAGDEKDEAEENNKAARLWINGLEIVKRKLGVQMVYDLSATPFFLRGSGYAEGTLFPWVVSDFSLIDAIECGIVKLPRVPVSDNIPGEDVPVFRALWPHIRDRMPKKSRNSAEVLDPLKLPVEVQTALDALYGHYTQVTDRWEADKVRVPPVFIIVCSNTAASKVVYEYVSGFMREAEGGKQTFVAGHFPLFRNYDEHGNRLARPNTLLIDSAELESGEALSDSFRSMAADEIERFRREMVQRTGDQNAGARIADDALLREVMNTVGKVGKLGETVRCVVSVSMLTEGWDANTVTHILGLRAFGTQLLCEQVVGRALRRLSYDLNDEGLFNVEYADVLGIPFDFAAKPVVGRVAPPRESVHVHAVRPERDSLEITFPNIDAYRLELPDTRLSAKFGPDSKLVIDPDVVGPSITRNQGILGEGVRLTLAHLEGMRAATIVYHLTRYLLLEKFRDPGEEPKLHLFGQLKQIVRQWIEGGYLECVGSTYPAQVIYLEIAEMAAERIKAAIAEAQEGDKVVRAIPAAFNPVGSTHHVNFHSSKLPRVETDHRKCPVNWVICDSTWEAEFCEVVESHPRVVSYVKNHGLGFFVPYTMGFTRHRYLPDFIIRVDDGREDLLNLVVEIKGYRKGDALEKANTMRTYWIPGVNRLGRFGRWEFAEFAEVFKMEQDFSKLIDSFVVAAAV